MYPTRTNSLIFQLYNCTNKYKHNILRISKINMLIHGTIKDIIKWGYPFHWRNGTFLYYQTVFKPKEPEYLGNVLNCTSPIIFNLLFTAIYWFNKVQTLSYLFCIFKKHLFCIPRATQYLAIEDIY